MTNPTTALVTDQRRQQLIESRRRQGLPDAISDTATLTQIATVVRRCERA